MLRLKHKYNIRILGILILLSLALPLLRSHAVAADSQTTKFACADSSTQLKVASDSQLREVVVQCADSARIDYLLNTQYAKIVTYTATCANSHPGATYPTPITMIIHCYSGSATAQGGSIVNVLPTFQQLADQVQCTNGQVVATASNCTASGTTATGQTGSGKYVCGDNSHGGAVHTEIDFGCKGAGNPIADLLFAILRFLSDGVGLVLVASMVWAGIQYTSSRGDPQATAAALRRVRANVIALILFIFAYAILNFVVPGAVLG